MRTLTWVSAVAMIAVLGMGQGNATAADGATLNAVTSVPPTSLDPHKGPQDFLAYPYTSLFYDRLTQIVAGPELAPMLATSWTFSEDGMAVTFDLRPGVVFSDGTPLDAAAVKASLDRAVGDPESTARGRFASIVSVDALDPLKVRVTANRKAADLPYLLSSSYASIISPSALKNSDLNVKPVGSGPYVLDQFRSGESVSATKNPNYWDREAGKPLKITLRGAADDNARMSALRSGQADLIIIKAAQVAQARSLGADFGYFAYPAASTYSVYFNTGSASMQDLRVRQAINYAIDRQAINTYLLNGTCAPNTQPLTPGTKGYLDQPPVDYSYDADKARNLLKEAGADGAKLTLLVAAGAQPQSSLATALQDQLRLVGLDVEVVAGNSTVNASNFAKGMYDMYVSTRLAGPTGAMTLESNFLNPSLFPGPRPAEVAASLATAFDPNVGEEALVGGIEAASRIIVEQAYDGFICALPTFVAYSTKVRGGDRMGVSFYQGIPDLRYVGIESD